MIKLEFSIRDARRAQEIIADMRYINGLVDWTSTNTLEMDEIELGEELYLDLKDLGIEVELFIN